jgi:hypothetical protein
VALFGLLWYLLAIFVWWLVGGVMAGGLSQYSSPGDLAFGIAIIAFFDISWWLPYISYVAVTEKVLSVKLPRRNLPLFAFLAVGLALFTLLALTSKGSKINLWELKVLPAAAVTMLYFLRRLLRKSDRASAEQASGLKHTD